MTTIPAAFPEYRLPQTIPKEVNPQNKTYLQRCVEEIDRTKEIAAQFDHHATAYKVAAYAAIGLFIAVAAAASILVGIYFSPFLPIVGLTTLCLVNPALTCIKKLLAISAVNELCAKRRKGIAEEYQKVQANPEESQKNIRKLSSYYLLNEDPGKFDQYKVLLAHYNYWDNLRIEAEKQVNEKIAGAKKVKLQDRITIYIEAASLRQTAHAAKISQAFVMAIMNNPEFAGMPDDLAYVKDFSLPVNVKDKMLGASLETNEWAQHALLRDFDDEDAEDYLVFKNPTIQPVLFGELDKITPERLSVAFSDAINGIPTATEEQTGS